MRSQTWRRFYFRGKKWPKMCLKLNRKGKKGLDKGLVWELLAPGYGLLFRFKTLNFGGSKHFHLFRFEVNFMK